MEPRTRRLRPHAPIREDGTHRVAIFTSVDGTLLDHETFEPGPCRAAIRKLQAAGIPVIPVTVMTLDEIEPIARDLGLRHAMIIEAGGAIARWRQRQWEVEPFGPPAETFLDVVSLIEDRSGANLLVYSAMPERDAANVSGRRGDMLRASTRRAFSEPFLIESGELSAIEEAAEEIGFSVRRGPRFFHLSRACDRGEAFQRIRQELQCDLTIGIGGSAVDAEFLLPCDIPIVIPQVDGTADAALLAAVRGARVAREPGPAGWAASVEQFLSAGVSRRRRANGGA